MPISSGPPAPLVSVIVLTWNRQTMLAESVDSILASTMGDLELLVIDNESTDATEAYVRGLAEVDPRVRYFRHANAGIISANRNFGISQARGTWVAFCDDDDLWLPAKLERQLAEAASDPECVLVSTDAVRFTSHGDYGLINPSLSGRLAVHDFLNGVNPVLLASVLVKRDVFAEVGGFNEDPELFTIEDYEIWLRVASRFHVRVLAEPLIRYRVHAGAASHRDRREVLEKVRVMFTELHGRGVLSDGDFAEGLANVAARERRARLAEAFKAVPGIPDAYYRVRAVIFRLTH